MAEKYDIELKIAADVADIKKATTELNKFKERFTILQEQLKQGFFLNFGAGIGNQIKSILSSAIPAYGKQEEAERGLASAMEATGVSVQKNIEYFKELAGKIQDATKIGDEQVLSMQSLALNMGVNAEQMQECIQGAIGLQRAYGIGLNEAIRASAAVVQGKTEKLNELIPALSKCKTNEEKLAMANRAMSNGYKQAKGDVDTLNGTLTQLANAWGDVAEILGEAVAPAVKAGAELLKGLADIIRNNSTAVVWLTRGIVAFVAMLAVNKIGNYMKALKGMINSFKDGAVAVASETKALNENTSAKLRNASASKALNAANSGKSKNHLEGGFKAFMRQTPKADTPAQKPLYSLIIDAKNTAEAKKLAQATQSLGRATSSVGAMSRIGAAGLGLFTAAFNPLTIAIAATTAAIAYFGAELSKCREAQEETQNMFDNTASSATSRSNALMEKMRNEGAELEEVFKNRKTIETELRGLLNAKRIAEENNDSWNPFVKDVDVKALDNAIAAHRNMLSEINAEANAYDRMVRSRNEAYEEKASENMRQSKDKYSDTKLTDQEKLSRITDQLALKKQTISDIENNIKNAQGEQKLKLSEIYQARIDEIIALEKEHDTLQKSVEAEKKAAQDKADTKAKEISDGQQRLLQMQNELSYENELNLAKIQGNTKEVERLETKKRQRTQTPIVCFR